MNISTIDITKYLIHHPGLAAPERSESRLWRDSGSQKEILNQVQNDGGVVIYSNNPVDKNSIENAAKICQTIPYDLLIHLASSTKRVIV